SPIADAYAAADIALARAGTSTVAELTAWGIPSVLVPLPSAAADHQTLNAVALETAGASVHLGQSHLTGTSLNEKIVGLLSDTTRLERMRSAALQRARPNAAAEIARRIVALL